MIKNGYPAILLDSQSARNYYNNIMSFVKDRNHLKIDGYTIAMAANCLHLYAEAVKKVEEKGSIQIFKTGHSNVSAYYTVMRDQLTQFQSLSDRLGLDPKARQKLVETAQKKAGSLFDEFM
jgi:P27 family predicted phage terminase small subunit